MSITVRARVSSKGQLTIPKAVRDALNMHEGSMVEFELGEGEATVRPVTGFLARFGSLKVPGAGPVDWADLRRRTAEAVGRQVASEGRDD
jgi:antitoxin PrlF